MAVFRRDGFRCLACGSEDDLTIDHVQHQSAGGRHGIENLRTLCRSCNSRRGSGHLPEIDGEAR
ncbi:HNH endonuclease [Streptomyces sp. NPDC014744]|uniref:HNH endonuclease n=1 Tax=Streptomyces sp. NPDC014744 TaxID=3364903 RepID=UPI003702849D